MQDGSVVLVADGIREHADGIAQALEGVCGRVIAIYSAAGAIEKLEEENIDVLVTDIDLDGDTGGLELLRHAKNINSQTQVIVVASSSNLDACKEAMRAGAYDYVVKPVDTKRLAEVVTAACNRGPTRVTVSRVGRFEFEGVRGANSGMAQVFEIVRRVAPTNISVLIEGESGTGKELLARAIHNNSRRRNKAFKPVNCAGLSETLLESELFGHVKGAFTGALSDREGLFEAADKGTLFLDEIGDMPMIMQAKLLRVLEDGLIMPVGSTKPVKVDVRVVSATNHDLVKLIEEKKFRQDLYFRIKGVCVTVPALRSRSDDLPELAGYFLEQANDEIGKDVRGFTDNAMKVFKNYNWPGNIRQLRNAIRTMVVMTDGDFIDACDVPPEIYVPRKLNAASPIALLEAGQTPVPQAGSSLDDLERQAVIKALADTGGNREKAAKLLKIGERTLYRKIKEYDLV
ncbi:MAG: hypothetical protein A2Y07_01790 [Planctomycetes bacterium GWF2_50_10]|nr:MAG: hypothetical protein A2Y07_01790 [Planctomycetes bacterium GWF2_50_10]